MFDDHFPQLSRLPPLMPEFAEYTHCNIPEENRVWINMKERKNERDRERERERERERCE